MITNEVTYECTRCKSTDIVKNGRAKNGKKKYGCKSCGYYGTLNPEKKYSEERKEEILRAYHEQSSLRGLERIFGVARQMVARWLKEKADKQPPLEETLIPSTPDDVLELDELWSFVGKKSNKRWIWIALCRQTRQVVAYYIGDRSEKSCWCLWQRIPSSYRMCRTFSDFWDTYQTVFGTFGVEHHSVGKETGETAHVERWNNTLRQRLAHFVRKSLSFSKSDLFHEISLKLFLYEYNLSLFS